MKAHPLPEEFYTVRLHISSIDKYVFARYQKRQSFFFT